MDDGALDRDSLKLLAKSADTAAKSLKALDKFTGRQLAEAFDADGKFDATTKAGKAIFAAVTAQQELSDLLPRQALAMHGTADALATVCEEVFVVSPTFRFGCPMRRRSQA